MDFSQILSNTFNVISSIFLSLFLIVLFYVMINATRKMDMTDLFKRGHAQRVSHTKFWSNIAYFAATLAFLSLNVIGEGAQSGVIEAVWIIYLGVVASNDIASKWITNKYNGFRRESQEKKLKEKPDKIDNPDEEE